MWDSLMQQTRLRETTSSKVQPLVFEHQDIHFSKLVRNNMALHQTRALFWADAPVHLAKAIWKKSIRHSHPYFAGDTNTQLYKNTAIHKHITRNFPTTWSDAPIQLTRRSSNVSIRNSHP